MREYSRKEYKDILGKNLTESKVIDRKMEEVYKMVREMEKQKKKRSWKNRVFIGMSAVAAMFILTITISVANPAFAAKIPVLNVIFKTAEQQISYKGDFSENSIFLADTEATEDSPYISTVEGVTITAGEAYYNDEALYLGMHIFNEAGFSEEFRAGCMVEEKYGVITMESTAIADLSASGQGVLKFDAAIGTETPRMIEGNFMDKNNFSGIIRVPLESFGTVDEMGNFTQVIPKEQFVYSLSIMEIYDEFGSENTIEGPWDFTFDVKLDTDNTTVIQVNEKNADGIGISTVTKTLYEMKAELVIPEGVNAYDYTVVMYDKNGNPLESQGGDNAEVYSLNNIDGGEITICVFDYLTYMDECKAKNIKEIANKYLFMTKIEV